MCTIDKRVTPRFGVYNTFFTYISLLLSPLGTQTHMSPFPIASKYFVSDQLQAAVVPVRRDLKSSEGEEALLIDWDD